MNPILKDLMKTSLLWTFVLAAALLAIEVFFWPEMALKLAAAVFGGALLGEFGLWLIIAQTRSITEQQAAAKKTATLGYMGRYLLYGVILLSMTLMGLPVLAALSGFLCSKASLIIYALQHRKDT